MVRCTSNCSTTQRRCKKHVYMSNLCYFHNLIHRKRQMKRYRIALMLVLLIVSFAWYELDDLLKFNMNVAKFDRYISTVIGTVTKWFRFLTICCVQSLRRQTCL